MHHHIKFTAMAMSCALLLAGCGGSDDDDDAKPPVVVQPPPAATTITSLTSTARGMESVAYHGGSAYLSLSNSKTEGSAVLKATLPVTNTSSWTPVPLGACAMGKQGDFIVRAPKLKMVGDDMWLMQPWADLPESKNESSTCTLMASSNSFVPRDQDLRVCTGGFCETLSMQDVKLHGKRLYSNPGAGVNLFTSNNGGNTWTVMRGQKASMVCTPTKFHVLGDRVLVGGECPLDMAFVEAYQLNADGSALASEAKLALNLPALENRNVQFIESVADTKRVFIGVEGGLLRSEDNGVSFKFVIQQPLSGSKNYPYITSFLPLKGKPDTMIIGGFDKATQMAYLAWSKDGGATWTDISNLTPNHGKTPPAGATVMIKSITEDPQGRILVTMNELGEGQGKLLLLNLGG
ncbi:hypothetical protein [Massilia sp. CFBP9026]|uniref:hypothetical protein n=1 Tax=Massilia sp. CFBP9026 TaxID=3096536 RepID=UPI002A6B1ECB|nr:hypothetical protein [Massilia sp. CFBP9026]MDY0960955.1 hypothetical protein [Massilia sp. CFBP9026]